MRSWCNPIGLLAVLSMLLAACAGAERTAPGHAVTADRQMVVAANPLAAAAGLEMLRAGGNAVDAAIATQMMLTLVEPQSSGLGGGGFLLHYDATTGEVTAYEGRETAPAAATPDMFLDAEGAPLAFYEAVVGGLSVGAPGVLRMLEAVHRAHGRLPWADLFQPAIRLAEQGFAVSPRLHRQLAGDEHLKTDPTAAAYFYDADGNAWPPGHVLKNPALAETLRLIAAGGADAFYLGPIARDIVFAVQNDPRRPGRLTEGDLAAYAVNSRPALCRPYRVWRVCGAPPPSSGGIAVLQMLGMLEPFDLAAMEPMSADAVHLLSQAGRLAFADRGRYVADDAFVDVPTEALLDRGYLRSRAALVDMEKDMGEAAPGALPAEAAGLPVPQTEPVSTSHMSIADAQGNAVSFTTSIENEFGARLMVRGFLLNNQLTDFAFTPETDGLAVANRVEPGKRPRSSMSPTLVFGEDGALVAAVGSPGGSSIIGYVAKALVAMLDWGLDPQTAVDLPNALNRNGATRLEEGTPVVALAGALAARGHELEATGMTSGLHAILIRDGRLLGGADRRREGVALGD